MKSTNAIAALLIIGVAHVNAETKAAPKAKADPAMSGAVLTLTSGPILRDYEIKGMVNGTLRIWHRDGIADVQLRELPPALHERFKNESFSSTAPAFADSQPKLAAWGQAGKDAVRAKGQAQQGPPAQQGPQQPRAVPKADPLPPFPEMVDEAQPDIGQLRHAADWADTFGRADTNLAMRQKHARDIDAYNVALAKVVAAEYELLTGKKVELALGDMPKLLKQIGELSRAVAAIREQQKAEAMKQEALAAVAGQSRVDADWAAMQQEAAFNQLRAKQAELEQDLQRLRK